VNPAAVAPPYSREPRRLQMAAAADVFPVSPGVVQPFRPTQDGAGLAPEHHQVCGAGSYPFCEVGARQRRLRAERVASRILPQGSADNLHVDVRPSPVRTRVGNPGRPRFIISACGPLRRAKPGAVLALYSHTPQAALIPAEHLPPRPRASVHSHRVPLARGCHPRPRSVGVPLTLAGRGLCERSVK